MGGLISYGVGGIDLWRRAAPYVDRILRGANPGDLPVQQPTKFELVINIKSANTNRLTTDSWKDSRISGRVPDTAGLGDPVQRAGSGGSGQHSFKPACRLNVSGCAKCPCFDWSGHNLAHSYLSVEWARAILERSMVDDGNRRPSLAGLDLHVEPTTKK
jgi:ABC transporter substrate binding protein